MAKSIAYVLICLVCCLFTSAVGANNGEVGYDRNLESSIQSSDELGKFYYPVSLLKIPKDKREELTPLNTKDGEKQLDEEELVFNTDTGKLTLYHKNESTPGEIVITITSSSKNKYILTVEFMEEEYFNIPKYAYFTPYWGDCPMTSTYDPDNEGYLPEGPLNLFGLDLTRDRVAEIFGYDIDKKGDYRFMYINILGYLHVPEEKNYTFFIQSAYGSFIELDGEIIVSSYETCNGSKVELSSKGMKLTPGYHSFKYHVISGFERNGESGAYGGYGFDFKMKIGDGGKQHIELYNKVDYKIANTLIFFKSSYSWGKGVYQQIEFTVKDADSCATIPPLPSQGYKIELGLLTGLDNIVSVNTYSVYCSSPFSKTNIFNITIEITDIFLKGLVAYYMKYDEILRPNNFLPNRNKEYSHLKVLRIEEIANKEYSEDVTLWKGLGGEFMSEFGVHWEGVIKYPKSGTYTYKLTCDDSCNIKLKKSYEVRAFTYTGNVNATTTTDINVNENDELDQYFCLEYMQYKGSSTVELLIKGPDDDDFHYPSEWLFYNPPSRLEYTYIISSYLVDKPVPISNKPLFNGITIDESDKPKFSINKDLPQGITLDENTGYIEGLPTEPTKRDEFIITATFTKREPLQTMIFITVEDIKMPTNVYIFNEKTNEKYFTTGTIQLGSLIQMTLSEDSGVSVAAYYLTGNLPTSVYDLNNGKLNGFASEVGEYPLYIQACNGAGCTSSNITITIEDQCKDDEDLALFILSTISGTYEFSLDDSTGKSVITPIEIVQPREKWSKTVCLKNAEYTANIWNNINYYATFTVEILMDGVTVANVTKRGAGFSGGRSYVTFQATCDPSPITYSTTEIVFEQYVGRSLSPSFYNTLTDFKIEPDTLPEGITLSRENGVIGGMCDKNYPKRTYTISAVSVSGYVSKVNVTIEVVLTKCIDKGYALIHVYTSATGYGRENVNVEIRDSNNNITFQLSHEFLETHFYRCIPPGDYTFVCKTLSSDGQGWNGGYADVLFYEAPMGHCSIENGDGPHEYTAPLHLSYGVDSSTEWQYSTSYEQGWNKNNFGSKWPSSKLGDIDSTTATTLYLRKIIPIHDLDSFSAFYTRIDVFSGFVYYVNETEVGRINLPQYIYLLSFYKYRGELSDTQKANKSLK